MDCKKVLVVSAVYPPEPVVSARLSNDIYSELKRRGCAVIVFHPQPTRPLGYMFHDYKEKGDEIVASSYTCPKSSLLGRFRESLSFGKETYKYISTHRKDISAIYANTWPLFGQYYLVKAAKKYHIPCYIHVQDIYPDSYCHKMPKWVGKVLYNVLLPIDKYVLKNATGVIAISPSMIPYLSKSRGVQDSKFTLVRNWQDDHIYIDSYNAQEKKNPVCEIMYLGSINPTANVPLLLAAVKTLDKSKYHLSVIGNGPDKEHCIEKANQYGLNVTFDTVNPEQVASKQSEASILALCLKKGVAQTATPSKLTAYMLTGRPIIASVDLNSDCANIIRESGCGLVVEPGNAKALAEAIETINQKDIDKLKEMGNRAYNYALENLSKQKNLKKLTDVILATYNDGDKESNK